jgi:hypothetical protein
LSDLEDLDDGLTMLSEQVPRRKLVDDRHSNRARVASVSNEPRCAVAFGGSVNHFDAEQPPRPSRHDDLAERMIHDEPRRAPT